jgi:hypothetical protein
MFSVVMTGYFLVKVTYYGIIQFIGNPALSVRFVAFMQVLEFAFLVSILFIFRPRALPAFYTLSLNEINVTHTLLTLL